MEPSVAITMDTYIVTNRLPDGKCNDCNGNRLEDKPELKKRNLIHLSLYMTKENNQFIYRKKPTEMLHQTKNKQVGLTPESNSILKYILGLKKVMVLA